MKLQSQGDGTPGVSREPVDRIVYLSDIYYFCFRQVERQSIMREKKGYLQVYTGDGKGKTTAAIGLAVRAALAGKRVFVGQFVKNMRYHECRIEELLPVIHFEQFGLGCALIHEPSEEDVRHGREGLARAAEVMASGEWDVVVLDEVTIALYFHFFTVEELLEVIRAREPHVEVVCTGRYAPADLIAAADLVTDMQCVKHYYDAGVPARSGFER